VGGGGGISHRRIEQRQVIAEAAQHFEAKSRADISRFRRLFEKTAKLAQTYTDSKQVLNSVEVARCVEGKQGRTAVIYNLLQQA
jgi:hypothetical protein